MIEMIHKAGKIEGRIVWMWECCVERWWLECITKETAEKAKLNTIYFVRDVKRKDACPPCDKMFWSFDLSVGSDEVGND